MKTKGWFEVDREGLKQLQGSKCKSFILRELIQNAWDEQCTECSVEMSWCRGAAVIVVRDNSPEGFKSLTDAFTLFAATLKRENVKQRGRFNLGEKQVLALCKQAVIETTKGTVIFNSDGTREIRRKASSSGSSVSLNVAVSREEYEKMLDEVKTYLPPESIKFVVNGEVIAYSQPEKVIRARLQTEMVDVEGLYRRQTHDTEVRILNAKGKARLYELGLPVCDIDCQYDLDVQQKVPLSMDRETVPLKFLESLYAQVLNNMIEEVKSDNVSQCWVRVAAGSSQVDTDVVAKVIQLRYGDKVVVASPTDKNSIDEALSSGYRVVYGSEMSREEWGNIKSAGLMSTSSELFGADIVSSTPVVPDADMVYVAKLAKLIAVECLGFEIRVRFAKWLGSVQAQYGNRELLFNVQNLGTSWFAARLSQQVLDLIIHELAHEKGRHTESGYHAALTFLGAKLVMTLLQDPEFFNDI